MLLLFRTEVNDMAHTSGITRSFRPYTDALRRGVGVWLTEKGKPIFQAQQNLLVELLPSVVGDVAVQVSVGTPVNMLLGAKMPQQWQLSREAGGHVQADPCYLPFARRSLDLLLLHHSLDFEDDPHQVLHRAVDALAAGGTLIVLGFHPFSLFALGRLQQWQRPVPWQGRFLRPQKVAEWLRVLNCDVEHISSACYGGPKHIAQGVWQRLGERYWPKHGAFCLLVARKRTAMMRPLPNKATKAGVAPTMVGVSLARTAKANCDKVAKSEWHE